MKIKKNSLLEKVLVEADEEPSVEVVDSDDISTTELAKTTGMTTQAAAAVKDAADTLVVADPELQLKAELGTEDDVITLGVENRITKALDRCLKAVKNGQYMHLRNDANLCLIGLPGSAKTASVEDWCRYHGLNLVKIAATDNDLKAGLYGYTIMDREHPTKNIVTKAESAFLYGLRKKNTVLFLDEFTRANYEERGALLTLINNKSIPATGHPDTPKEEMPEALKQGYYYKDSSLHFPNLLFTVIAANPASPTDRGAKPFNSAELSRAFKILDNLNSDKGSTTDYFNKLWDYYIAKLDKQDPKFLYYLRWFIYAQDMGKYIVNHHDFEFSNVENDRLATNLQKKAVNQRTITQMLINAEGDPDLLEDDLKDGSAGFMDGGPDGTYPNDIEMLLKILKSYKAQMPDFEELVEQKRKDLDKRNIKNDLPDKAELAKMLAGKSSSSTAASTSADDEEADSAFFGGAAKGGRAKKGTSAHRMDDKFAAALGGDWGSN